MTSTTEQWRDIVGYEGFYQVSDMGRIRSLDRQVKAGDGTTRRAVGRVLQPGISHNGYLMVRLCQDGYAWTQRVNRLVAHAFLPNTENLSQVNHKNGIKTDNSVENLEWCTASYNQRHRRHVLGRTGECRKAVLCLETGKTYPSLTEAAQSLNLSLGNLSMVCQGKRPHTKNLHFKYIEEE